LTSSSVPFIEVMLMPAGLERKAVLRRCVGAPSERPGELALRKTTVHASLAPELVGERLTSTGKRCPSARTPRWLVSRRAAPPSDSRTLLRGSVGEHHRALAVDAQDAVQRGINNLGQH